MLIRVNIDGMTRHYCADCAAQVPEASGGHCVGKGWCYGCGLVGGGKGRRVKVQQPELERPVDIIQRESEQRLARALTGTTDEGEPCTT